RTEEREAVHRGRQHQTVLVGAARDPDAEDLTGVVEQRSGEGLGLQVARGAVGAERLDRGDALVGRPVEEVTVAIDLLDGPDPRDLAVDRSRPGRGGLRV